MSRRVLVLAFGVLLLASLPVSAGNGPKPKAPKPAAAAVKPAKAVAPKPVKAVAPKPAKVSSRPVKAASVKPAKGSEPKALKTTKTTKATKTTKTVKDAVARTTEPGTTGTPTSTQPPLTKVQQKLQSNTKLASKLEGRLPAGTDVVKAAAGFKNLGQFVAAVNVSHNHDIPFARLKRLMVREGYSLGQSMQQLKPSSRSATDARRAEADAQRLIASTEPRQQ